MDMEEVRLLEVDNIKTLYVDGIASARQCGANAKVIYFEYRMWCGELVRMPVLQMVRPIGTYEPGLINRMIVAHRTSATKNLIIVN